jgi:hypothetical protein
MCRVQNEGLPISKVKMRLKSKRANFADVSHCWRTQPRIRSKTNCSMSSPFFEGAWTAVRAVNHHVVASDTGEKSHIQGLVPTATRPKISLTSPTVVKIWETENHSTAKNSSADTACCHDVIWTFLRKSIEPSNAADYNQRQIDGHECPERTKVQPSC